MAKKDDYDLPNVGGAEEETRVTGTNDDKGQPVEEAKEVVEPTREGEPYLDHDVATGQVAADPAEQEAHLRELGVYADPSDNGE